MIKEFLILLDHTYGLLVGVPQKTLQLSRSQTA